MYPRVRHQVGLELVQVDIESSVKPKTGSDGRDYLRDDSVQVAVGGQLDVQVTSTDVVDCLIVDHEGTV